MAQIIDLEGLPEYVARAIAKNVLNLKESYKADTYQLTNAPPERDLPASRGKVIGSLRRVDIYDER